MSNFKISIINAVKKQKDKLSDIPAKKEKRSVDKNVRLNNLIDSNSPSKNFNTSTEALGEIFNLLVKKQKQKQNNSLNFFNEGKKQQNRIEERNKELIQALTGKTSKQIKEKTIKNAIAKTSSSKKYGIDVAMIAVISAGVAASSFAGEPTTPKETKVSIVPKVEPRKTETGVQRQEEKKAEKEIQESVFTGPMVPLVDEKKNKEEQERVEATRKREEEAARVKAEKEAEALRKREEAEAARVKADTEKEQNSREKFRKSELDARKKEEEEAARVKAEADRKKAESEATRKREEEAARVKAEADRKKAEAEREQNSREKFRKSELDNRKREEEAARERAISEDKIANRRDEEAGENKTLQKVSQPTPIVPLGQDTSVSGPNPPPLKIEAVSSASLEGRKIYSIGDSHAEGLAYDRRIINMANGGQPSTSSTNFGGTWRGPKDYRRFGAPVGLGNIPQNQIVFISQGANDTANAMKSYTELYERRKKIIQSAKEEEERAKKENRTPKKIQIPTEPVLKSPNIIASDVKKVVDAAKAAGHIVVFALFPNGPGRGGKGSEWYGGEYQEKVRTAISSAVGVPIIDLGSKPLSSDGIHSTSKGYLSAADEAITKVNKMKSSNISNTSNVPNKVSDVNYLLQRNIFDISNENVNLFSEMNNTINIANLSMPQKSTRQSNLNIGNELNQIQDGLISDKSLMFSKSYEMKELIIG